MKRVKTAAICGIYGVEDISNRLNKLLPTIEAPNVEIMSIQVVLEPPNSSGAINRCDALVTYRVDEKVIKEEK